MAVDPADWEAIRAVALPLSRLLIPTVGDGWVGGTGHAGIKRGKVL